MANSIRQSVTSLEYRYAIIADQVQGLAVDPTSDSVQWAFVPAGSSPVSGTTFYTGSWVAGGPPFTARCLVGPGGAVALTVGSYGMWVKVTDNPEIPVVKVKGALIIY